MSEVEKMYENAGVEPVLFYDCESYNQKVEKGYLFTPKKQLELIKWLSTKELKIRTNKQPYAVYVGVLGDDNTCFYGCEGLYLEQTLSELINHLWQSLTEEERKQIKEVLNG